MKHSPILAITLTLISLSIPACSKLEGEHHEAAHEEEHGTIVVTCADARDVTTTQEYVCQIHSRRHIEVCALEGGYLEEIHLQEGQAVKQGDLMFKIRPTIYQAKRDTEAAEAKVAELELKFSKQLAVNNAVSQNEVALYEAKLAKARAELTLAEAELNFTNITAPFDGIIDRLLEQQGSLVEEGEVLTTMSDNDVMWVYFNVPEARYLEYKASEDREDNLQLELMLANGEKFCEPGQIAAIEADFNNETGNIAFRADFPNPNGLLRHGQTGTVLIDRPLHDAIVIPQRATFEILAKHYVYVIGEDGAAHQREIFIQNEMEDIFVIQSGLTANDKIVLEGVRQVRDGEKVEFEYRNPKEVLAQLKYHAE